MGGHIGFNPTCDFVFWAGFVDGPVGQFAGHSMGDLGGHPTCHFGRIGLTPLACGFLGPSTPDGHAHAFGKFTRQCLAIANASVCLGSPGYFGWLVVVTNMAMELACLGCAVHVANLPVASS